MSDEELNSVTRSLSYEELRRVVHFAAGHSPDAIDAALAAVLPPPAVHQPAQDDEPEWDSQDSNAYQDRAEAQDSEPDVIAGDFGPEQVQP